MDNFKTLYDECRETLRESLVSLWTDKYPKLDANGHPQENPYRDALETMVNKIVAPETTMPVVQSMFPWETIAENVNDVPQLVHWNKPYPPYVHQYNSWRSLLVDRRSICVTTGTGSGKTECFILPVVKAIADSVNQNNGMHQGVQAILLYPLNALADDQRKRVNDAITAAGGNLTFAVYNGTTRENPVGRDENNEDDDFGVNDVNNEDDEFGVNNVNAVFDHERTTRRDIRANPPDILITNPTMLEYIMLRTEDAPLLAGGALRWFVIDETHTFKGAAAAELAMLVRRVIIAYGVDRNNVQFITSSATVGADNDEELKKFIADISWRSPADIDIIRGHRIIPQTFHTIDPNADFQITRDRQSEIARVLNDREYIALNELIHDDEANCVSAKLGVLDKLCDENIGLMAKVHFFFQAPTEGLSVKLSEIENGRFQLHNEVSDGDTDHPLLELVCCQKCGAFIAKGTGTWDQYHRDERSYDSIFDVDNDTDDDVDDNIDNNQAAAQQEDVLLFSPAEQDNDGVSNANCRPGDGASLVIGAVGDDGLSLHVTGPGRPLTCPHCGERVSGYINPNREGNENRTDQPSDKYLRSFCLSQAYLSRVLAPVFLNHVSRHNQNNNNAAPPHDGQQFISFMDSRQGAARITLSQSLDIEAQWLQHKVFQYLSANPNNIYSWNDICDYLLQDAIINCMMEQFIPDMRDNGHGVDYLRRRYALTLMYEQLAKRPRNSNAPETLGLFTTYYKKLEHYFQDPNVALPQEVNAFNEQCQEENRIQLEDWKNLIQMYLDYVVRSDGSIFYKRDADGWNVIDINSCKRLKTKKTSRRPARVLMANDNAHNRFCKILCGLAGWDNAHLTTDQLNLLIGILGNGDNDEQNNDGRVFGALKTVLKQCGLLRKGQYYDRREGQWKVESQQGQDNICPYRINLCDISFKPYSQIYICPTTKRPIPYTFKGYSPYLRGNEPVQCLQQYPDVQPYPFNCNTIDEVKQWCQENRPWMGNISNRTAKLFLNDIQPFVSAEHTAQLGQDVLREHMEKFNDHEINVLTCSTTMEMGVDIEHLDLVCMNSIPPQPANYKQRAGRSGRNGQRKSVAVTICDSDSIGKRVMRDAVKELFLRPIIAPNVDFNNRILIQRHINSLIIKTLGVIQPNARIYNFFAAGNYEDGRDADHRGRNQIRCLYRLEQNNHVVVYPDGLNNNNDDAGADTSRYDQVLQSLLNPDDDIIDKVSSLLTGTCFQDNNILSFINTTQEDLRRVKRELDDQFRTYREEWERRSQQLGNDHERRLQDNYCRLLLYRFTDLLSRNLLMYFSNHQFTPNQAMPINIIEFETQKEDKFDKKKRPSYTLKRALSQYAPGRSVVLDNSNYVSAGVDWSDRFNNVSNAFVDIYQHQNLSIGFDNRDGDLHHYQMVVPTAFKCDVNQVPDRILDDNIYTKTEAYLVNAQPWLDNQTSRMIKVRGSVDDRTPQILFMNSGNNGMGYCLCTRCGRAEMETHFDHVGNPQAALPASFVDNRGRLQHGNINNSGDICDGPNSIKRNVVFGDFIQTDYCEIVLYYNNGIQIVQSNLADNKVLHTMGMLICNYLSEAEGIERGEIDYILTTYSGICIYDLAKGGAGYSNRLCSMSALLICFDTIREELTRRDNHDNYTFTTNDLIDSYTVYNEAFIDLATTRTWLQDEYNQRRTVPGIIRAIDNHAIYENCLKLKIINAIQANQNVTLFVNKDSIKNYQDFIVRNLWFVNNCNRDNTHICFYNAREITMTPLLYEELIRCQEHSVLQRSDAVNIRDDVYPVAKIGDTLYVTNLPQGARFCANWGETDIYHVVDNNALQIQDFVPQLTNHMAIFTIPNRTEIGSNTLLEKLIEGAPLINDFLNDHRGQDASFIYQDKHMKSALSIIITLQLIKNIATRLNTQNYDVTFSLTKYDENNSYHVIERYPDDRLDEALQSELWHLNMGYNIGQYQLRDSYLRKLATTIRMNVTINTDNTEHWRLLTITCGEESLKIYPDGGFGNGWMLGDNNQPVYPNNFLGEHPQRQVGDNINIRLRSDIKFDVQRC